MRSYSCQSVFAGSAVGEDAFSLRVDCNHAMPSRHKGLAQDYMRTIRRRQDNLCALSHILRRPTLVALNCFLEISKVRIMKNLHNAMRNMAAIMIGPVPASRLVCLARGLVLSAGGFV